MKKVLNSCFLLLLFSSISFSATYTVTNCDDAGAGSLRQAITDANANAGTDTIAFNIPTSLASSSGGVQWWSIQPASVLPNITETVSIDGTTQTANQGNLNPNGPEIEINGTNAGVGISGLTISLADDCTIMGVVINRFTYAGIRINDGDRNRILSNYLGTDINGTSDLGNFDNGIRVYNGSTSNIIGDGTTAGRNIISGNYGGIYIYNATTSRNEVLGNYFGTDRTGIQDLGNNLSGVAIDTSSYNKINNNVIAGNGSDGIWLSGSGNNEVAENYIGIGADNSTALTNSRYGIEIVSGASYNTIGPSNVIANNGSATTPYGILVDGATSRYNKISQNSIYSNYASGRVEGIGLSTSGNGGITPPTINAVKFYSYSGSTEITGSYAPASGSVEIYKSSGRQGKTYLGFATANSSGIWSATVTGLVSGDSIVALGITSDNESSEFSDPVLITSLSTSFQPSGTQAANIARFGPNPFNPNNGAGRLWYWLEEDKETTVLIIDLSGTVVWKQSYASGADGGKQGANSISFNGRTAWGDVLANGVYLYKVIQNSKSVGGGKIAVIK